MAKSKSKSSTAHPQSEMQPLHIDVVEKNSQPQNPYSERNAMDRRANQMFQTMKCLLFLAVASLGLHQLKVLDALLYSPDIHQTWFMIALALSVAILGLKSYVELYKGKTKKIKVNYETFRQETHAVILLFLATSVALNLALWPVYQSTAKTLLVTFMMGYGVVLQVMLLLPVELQNLLGAVFFTYVIQQRTTIG